MTQNTVPTLRGAVPVTELGRTLMHEHLFNIDPEFRLNYALDWDEDAEVEGVVKQLDEVQSTGIDTVVDLTVLGLGRDIKRMQRVAERSTVNILVSTGVYTYDGVPQQVVFRGPGLLFDEPEPLSGMFVQDIEQGIAGTSLRAAMLKCAIDEPGMTDGVRRIMKAVASAHLETGVPITVHTSPGNGSGLEAQRLLGDEGVDLTNVIIGHAGDSTDIEYLVRLADAGSILGMDRFGLDILCSFEDRVATLVELIRRGYTEQLVLSHDYACSNDLFPPSGPASGLPNFHLCHVTREVVPELLHRGVSEAQIETMLRANPARILAPR